MIQAYSKKLWFFIFIAAQVGMVLLIISRNTMWIKMSYVMQKYEQEYCVLLEEKKVLMHRLYELQSHDRVKHYAQNKLGMHTVTRRKIKKMG